MVAQATLLLFGSFFVMLLAGVPISAGIGIASIFTALFSMDPAIFALTAAQRCFSGIDSFSLLALPFFSLGGNIMNKGGIAKRLVRLARLAVGKMPGYLAATNVLANMFFGAVSGSSVAATSAMGSIMAPLELDEGYDPNYSAAVNICSAPTGILIPPSGPLILYSITAGGVSVAALFMGGYLPGILMGLCVAGLAVFIAVKKGYKSSDVKDPDPAIKIIIDAVPSLLAVIIVMGGILAGAGIALCFSQGGSTGGTDIVAMIINKYRTVSYGKILIYSDFVIIGSALLVGMGISAVIYGYVMTAVVGYTVDMIMAGNQQSSQVFIVTHDYEKMAQAIVDNVHRGVTLIDSQGWYSKKESKIVMVVCRKRETSMILKFVKTIDPEAFMTVGSVMGVYGKGFQAIGKG
jgi:tripartite ATP-independent transporter DctM subunit